jgi:hypothetical protein
MGSKMRLKKIFIFAFILFSILLEAQQKTREIADTLTIKSDKTEYEITIIEMGFNQWMNSNAKPRGFYSQNYLENYNKRYVAFWNNRASQGRFNDVFPFLIPYEFHVDYGYEVNYMLFHYFQFIQFKNPGLFPGIRRN